MTVPIFLKAGDPTGFDYGIDINIIYIMVNLRNEKIVGRFLDRFGGIISSVGVPGGRFRWHILLLHLPACMPPPSDLSILRKPAPSASTRSKAVDRTAAHSFQTGRCNGRVFPVSDKPDRFYCYDDLS